MINLNLVNTVGLFDSCFDSKFWIVCNFSHESKAESYYAMLREDGRLCYFHGSIIIMSGW